MKTENCVTTRLMRDMLKELGEDLYPSMVDDGELFEMAIKACNRLATFFEGSESVGELVDKQIYEQLEFNDACPEVSQTPDAGKARILYGLYDVIAAAKRTIDYIDNLKEEATDAKEEN